MTIDKKCKCGTIIKDLPAYMQNIDIVCKDCFKFPEVYEKRPERPERNKRTYGYDMQGAVICVI